MFAEIMNCIMKHCIGKAITAGLASVSMMLMNIQAVQAQDNDEQPLLTIGCLTDFHIEGQFLNYANPGQTDGVRLRQTTVRAIEGMKQEGVDMMLLGGDYTSLTTVDKANWSTAQQLLVDTIRSVFGDRQYRPAVYVTGNHEYQAPGDTGNKWYKGSTGSTKGWNSGDYYSWPMKQDIGGLAQDECFYETAGGMSLLAAFHYNILGVDVVALNTASCFFSNASSYSYTMNSARWCVEKIDALYADDPDRTVFFVIHIPFNDSNSLSSGKGIKGESGVPDYLKKGLAKHPNLIMLYGHDHGGNNAMIQAKTSQRVTRYDADGNKIATNDSLHVDGTMPGDVYVSPSEEPFTPFLCLRNVGNGKYIGKDDDDHGDDALNGSYLNMMTMPHPVTVTRSGLLFPHNGSTYYLQSNSSGNFSAKTSSAQSYLYQVEEPELYAKSITGTLATDITEGNYYIITQNGFALGNTRNTDSNYRRVIGFKPSGYSAGATGILLNTTDNYAYIYKCEKVTEQPKPVLDPGRESFFSIFMGSLRYHTDSFNPNGDYEDSSSKEPVIVQGLVIKLFSDRIEFRMKNYGQSGITRNGITIEKEPAPYTVFRQVKLVSPTPTSIAAPETDAPLFQTNGRIYDLSGKEVSPVNNGASFGGRNRNSLRISNGHKYLER